MDSPKIRVAIIDDNAKFRKSLRDLLEKEPDICVVAESMASLDSMQLVGTHKPDVILMDSNQPFTEGLDATQMVVSKFPDTRIIVVSMHSKTSMTASSCLSWACYPMCENCSSKEILAAIRQGSPGVKDAAHEMIP